MQATNPDQTHLPSRRHVIADNLLSLAVAALTLSFLCGTMYLWNQDTAVLFSAFRESIVVSLGLLVISAVLVRGRVRSLRLAESGFAWGMLLVALTDWIVRPYNLLQGEFIRGELILWSLVFAALLRGHTYSILRLVLPAATVILLSCFFVEAHGRLLFSDDNPTFMYRLALLKQNFPFIPFYNPLWNAGIEARDFFATGSLNVFLLFSPLLYLFNVFEVYNLVIAGILFLLLPLSIWFAARLVGARSPAPALAAVLALTASLLWYRWGLKYGTLGFLVSATLLPLNLALASRLCDPEHRPSPVEFFLSIASFTLMLFWSPSGLAFIPVAVLALSRISKLVHKRAFLSFSALLLLVNLPWMLVFWNVSNVGSFVQSKRPNYASMADADSQIYSRSAQNSDPHINTKPREGTLDLSGSIKRLRENAVSTNPLLVFLAIPALLLFQSPARGLFVGTALWLTLLGTVLAQVKPQLELDRMLIMLALLLCIPVADLLNRLWLRKAQSWAELVPASLCGGFLFAGIFSTAAILMNRSIEHFHFAEPGITKLAEAIHAHADGGRAVFSGFVLHDLYNGHIAPLVQLSSTSLVASSPFHDQWHYRELFPREVRDGGDTAIDSYLTLLNATLVLAHEDRWKQFFSQRPEHYAALTEGRTFNVYRRIGYASNYFLEGHGALIREHSNKIEVRIDSDSAVIKYKYFDFLKSSACTLSPHDAGMGLLFIRLSNCRPGETVTIEARGPLSRLIHGSL